MTAEPQIIRSKLSKEEEKAALDLVDEIQSTRALQISDKEVPKVLLPYQIKWHSDKSAIRICEKSRRIGFSWGALAAEAALEAASTKEAGGMDQFYMGYNMRMAAEFIGDCAFFAKAYGFAISATEVWKETVIIENERRDIVTYKIEMASGHKIEALSSNPHNWRSRQGHARIDEAAFHRGLFEVVKGALAFKMWGGRIDIVSTHNGEDNDFNAYIKDVKAGKLPWSLHRVTFDDALKDGFYERVCLVKGLEYSKKAEEEYREAIYADYPSSDDAAEELDCRPKRGSGAYFTRMLIEHCQKDGIPILRYSKPAEFVVDINRQKITQDWINDVLKPVIDNLPPSKRTVFGMDFGRDGDLSVVWVLQCENKMLWKTAFVVELRTIPFDIQWQITKYVMKNLPLFHHVKFDARGNGQEHAEKALQAFGSNYVDCVMLTQAWYAEWFPKYHSAYENKEIIVPKSEDIIADHRNVILKNGKPGMGDTRTKGSDGGFRHGDSAVAGLLAWAAARTEGEPAAGQSIDNDKSYIRENNSPLFRRNTNVW
ncbi:MAG: terminase family protein [Alphaproteobacteria bacterium]